MTDKKKKPAIFVGVPANSKSESTKPEKEKKDK
jgi:hypothetical protein